METRQAQLLDTQMFIQKVDQDLTMILQTLQWDRQHLQGPDWVHCSFDKSHRLKPDNRVSHERDCYLKCLGYSTHETLLPDPPPHSANTLVKLGTNDIKKIIHEACKSVPQFKKGSGCPGPEPLTLARLQATYTADERRAIHDAVVKAAPSCHDLSDLALPSNEEQRSKPKSRMDILAELRDMKRRRTKYRGATKSRNYSDVLRDVVSTQMEMYTEALAAQVKPIHTQERAYSKVSEGHTPSVSRSRVDDRSSSRNRGLKDGSGRREDSRKYERQVDRYDRQRDIRDVSTDSKIREKEYNDIKHGRKSNKNAFRQNENGEMRYKGDRYRDGSNSSRERRDDKSGKTYKKEDNRRHRDRSPYYSEKSKKHRYNE